MTVTRLCLVAVLIARVLQGVTIEQYHPHDFAFHARTSGNPFDVDLPGEFTGPYGTRLIVPGFYTGGTRGKSLFAHSARAPVDDHDLASCRFKHSIRRAIECAGNFNPAIQGGMLVDSVNRHHFIYQDGLRYFLLGYEADWLGSAPVYQFNGPESFGDAPGLLIVRARH